MPADKLQNYRILTQQIESLISDESDVIANMANISAVLFNHLPAVNWAGFYIVKEAQLVLGPFQGNPACIRIPIGKGVCGTAVSERALQLVDDVHAFSGHIACDAASNSEIVIPIYVNGDVYAVLDIDSPNVARFDQDDAQNLQIIVSLLEQTIKN